jgi:hypothetical protein
MGRYLMLWEVNQAKVAMSPQERGSGWGALMDEKLFMLIHRRF